MSRFVVGGLLLISAAMKLHHLLTSLPVVSDDWLASPRVQWLAVGWESALALWLWAGWRGNVSRWVALVTFGVFAAVSLNEAVAGKRTCCCFGAVPAQPWFVFVMDLGIVGLLYRIRPITTIRPIVARSMRVATMALAAVCLVSGVSVASWYSTPKATLHVLDWPDRPLVIESGGRSKLAFRISNPTKSAVTVAYFLSSCECLSVGTSCRTIPPGGASDALALLDFATKPQFTGDLNVTIKAMSEESQTLLIAMNLEVYVTNATPESIR